LLPEQFNNCYLKYLFIIIIIIFYFFIKTKKQYVKLKGENMGSTTIDSFLLLFFIYLFIYFLKLANQVWKQLFVFIIIYFLYTNIQILLF